MHFMGSSVAILYKECGAAERKGEQDWICMTGVKGEQ